MKKIDINSLCPKCGFPINEFAYRMYCEGTHDILENGEPASCSIKTEHIHISCTCGYIWPVGVFKPKTKTKGTKENE